MRQAQTVSWISVLLRIGFVSAYSPNTFDTNGVACSESWPSHVATCPPYCTRVKDPTTGRTLTEDKIVSACGTPCSDNAKLVPTGACVSTCEDANLKLTWNSATGFYECANATTTVQYANACACDGTSLASEYQACTTPQRITIDHFSTIENAQPPNGLVMHQCAAGDYHVITGNPQLDASITTGFVQCPTEEFATYKPTHFHMWFLSLFYLLPLGVIMFFQAYKWMRERPLDPTMCTIQGIPSPRSPSTKQLVSTDNFSPTNNIATMKTLPIERQETKPNFHFVTTFDLEDVGMKQEGFKETLVGRSAFTCLLAVAAGTIALILLQIMDAYGLLGSTFCPAETEACLELNPDESYTWRQGFKCSAHCLFGDEWSTGQSQYWPYAKGANGGKIYLLIFLLVWLFAAEFFVVLRLFRSTLRSWFLLRCPLDQATLVRVTLPKKVNSVADFNVASRAHKLGQWKEKVSTKMFGSPKVRKVCGVKVIHTDSSLAPSPPMLGDSDSMTAAGLSAPVSTIIPTRYIVFQSERLIWDSKAFRFHRATVTCGSNVARLCDQKGGLSALEAAKRSVLIGPNIIQIKMPTLLRSVFDEFFTTHFIYQTLCLMVWYEFYYWLAATCVAIVIFVSMGLSIRYKRLARRRLVDLATATIPISCFRDETLVNITSDNLTVGDVMVVTAGMEVPCDMILLTGSAILDESCLTGEPHPIPKTALESEFREIDLGGQDKKSLLLAGSRVVSVSRPGITALVTSVSVDTLRGGMLKELLSPTNLIFEFQKHWSLVFIVLFIWGLINVVLGVALIDWELEGWYYGIFTISQTISPLIPAVFVAGQSVAAKNLKKVNIYCANLQRTLVAAKIKHVCFDKTGTLTTPGLSLSEVRPLVGDEFAECVNDIENCSPRLRWALATCHELQTSPSGTDVTGVEVDVQMFRWTRHRLTISPQAVWEVTSPDGETRPILKRFGFQRTTVCSSVVIAGGQGLEAYTKGSWEAVSEMCRITNPALHLEARKLAAEGFYVLAIAHKIIPHQEIPQRSEVESDLTLLGLIAFRNDPLADSPQVVEELKCADINAVMITGDSVLTALRTATVCNFFDLEKVVMVAELNSQGSLSWRLADEEVASGDYPLHRALTPDSQLALTGDAYEFLKNNNNVDLENIIVNHAKVLARMNPAQKREVVELFMKHGVTAMIGDGANDAPALEVAHVGVAMRSGSGNGSKEATVVAHFSCDLGSDKPSLRPVVSLLKHGRSSLAGTTAAYKNLIIYGQITVLVSLIEMWLRIVPAEAYWITVDAGVNTLMTWAILSTKPANNLAQKFPTASLFSVSVLWSAVGQIVSNWIWMISAILMLLYSSFTQCKQFDARLMDHAEWWKKGDNYEAATLGLFALFQWSAVGSVMSFGNGFRAKWIKAYKVHIIWLVFLCVVFMLLWSTGTSFSCMFRTNCGDASLLNHWHRYGVWGGIVKWSVPEGGTSLIPAGCPCEGGNCEMETTCDAEQYHSAFHHNIFPRSWRWAMLGLMGVNLLCNYAIELAVMRKDNAQHRQLLEEQLYRRNAGDRHGVDTSDDSEELVMS
eukprot:Blabericola_migrator_1__1275@NODE_132_length_13257_cov_135_196133_g116_i0_p1_GENE_NODE_132_length_13257_cov_135_196133_g116_i0NODE_132_length_13257_cov_135_196133_g116_i0_p1_ORF_typecomplete_len1559_score308_80Hydrolase/PF00702_26/4_4e35E1E2_ATPase/PF00122_20/7_2e02E1E2_ATPase/PF00122_20/2_8e24Hydrolase_3/PF08282_12/0_00017_NODE_132_length_13257_cov_135_196133_g116_i0660111277